MRDTLLRHPWRLVAAASLLVAAIAIGPILILSGSLPATTTSTSSEPPPQAAASAPEPTLVSAQATAQATQAIAEVTPASAPEPSAFSGIAEPAPQPPARTAPVHHTVTEGEVLWQIAEQYNLRPETMLWANDIRDPDLLLIGQDLLIPPTDGVLYTVRSGDRLADVANRYGVDLQAIVNANHFDNVDQVQAGLDIFLPGGRPLSPTVTADAAQAAEAEQAEAVTGQPVPLPDNIDALLGAGWVSARHVTNLYKTAGASSASLHQAARRRRSWSVSAVPCGGRIQVRDPGDGRTRQAMTGWVDAVDLDVGRSPATRALPQAYPADTAMDIFHVFAPYRSQLDGSPYAEANCGPTALGMALDAFGVSVPPRQLRAEALDAQHMYGNGVGTLITALAQVVAAERSAGARLALRRSARSTAGAWTRFAIMSAGANRSSSRCAIARCPGAAARTTSATTTSW